MTSPAALRDTLSSQVIPLSLHEQLGSLRATAAYHAADHSAATLAKQPGMRLVLVAMKAEGQMGEHHTDSVISVLCLEGELGFTVAGVTHVLRPAELLVVSAGLPHSIRAIQPSAFLLTIGGQAA